MQTDFLDAHHRHWEDAEQLLGAWRWANADHLYGVAAECGLKKLMIAFGMPVEGTAGTPTDRADRVHIDTAWDRYETYRAGSHAALYMLPIPNPFLDWNVSQRYVHQSNFSKVRAEHHREGANTVRTLVNKAILEGIVT